MKVHNSVYARTSKAKERGGEVTEAALTIDPV